MKKNRETILIIMMIMIKNNRGTNMAKTIKGKINSVQEITGTSNKTGKTFTSWKINIDGEQYTTFNKDIGTTLKAGDDVQLGLTQQGKYENVTEILTHTKGTQQAELQETKTAGPNNKDTDIRLMNAANALSRIYQGKEINPPTFASMVKQFVEALYNNKNEQHE